MQCVILWFVWLVDLCINFFTFLKLATFQEPKVSLTFDPSPCPQSLSQVYDPWPPSCSHTVYRSSVCSRSLNCDKNGFKSCSTCMLSARLLLLKFSAQNMLKGHFLNYYFTLSNLFSFALHVTKPLKWYHWPRFSSSILCLTSRTTVTSARIPVEDACYSAHNLCVF